MLLAADFDEDFIDVESVAVSSVLSRQSPRVYGAKLYAPEADCFSRHSDAPLRQEIFNIAAAKIESIVKPDGVADDIGWESVAFVCIYLPILPIADA